MAHFCFPNYPLTIAASDVIPCGYIGVVAVLVCVLGCGSDTAIRSTDVRRYSAPKEKTLSADDIAQAGRQTSRPQRSRQIDYTLPEGWTEVSGPSGMRLATLAIGGEEGQEISIIPASGTTRSNVERWQKQLDEEASSEEIADLVDKAMAKAGSVDVQGKKATVVLLTEATSNDEKDMESILGGMLPMDDSNTLFVKFRGPTEIARKEQKKFIAFMASLRMLEGSGEQKD